MENEIKEYFINMKIIINIDEETELLKELREFTHKAQITDENLDSFGIKHFLYLYLNDLVEKYKNDNCDNTCDISCTNDKIIYRFSSIFNSGEEINTIKKFLNNFINYMCSDSFMLLLNTSDELMIFQYFICDLAYKNDGVIYHFSNNNKYNLRICRNCGKVLLKTIYKNIIGFSKRKNLKSSYYIKRYYFEQYTDVYPETYLKLKCSHCNYMSIDVDYPLLNLIRNLFSLGFGIFKCNYYTDRDFGSKYNYKEKDVYIDFGNNQNYHIEDIKKILENNIEGTDWELRYYDYYLRLYYPGSKSNIENVNILNNRIEKLLAEKKEEN